MSSGVSRASDMSAIMHISRQRGNSCMSSLDAHRTGHEVAAGRKADSTSGLESTGSGQRHVDVLIVRKCAKTEQASIAVPHHS